MARTYRPPRGQHFLRDPNILRKIASSLPLEPGDHVIEIGAGEGALTRHLIERGARVTAIEIEPRLAAELRETFGTCDSFEVLEADILQVSLRDLASARGAERTFVAGNLPYYITSPILRLAFAAGSLIQHAVFLMQHEVALRATARKGSRDFGYLSALCGLYSEPKYLFRVSPRAFRPPPKVTSAVVGFALRREAVVDLGFVEFLKLCFRQPRKKLVNNLSGAYDRALLAATPEASLRAQQLDVDELLAFWQKLEASRA